MELDEDDSHLCIRCNETIIGLQNYVNHRQRNCSATQNVKSTTKPFTTNFDFLNSHVEKKIENYADFSFGDERDDEIGINETNKSRESVEYNQYDYDFFSSLELQYMSKRDIPHEHQTGGKNFNYRILTRKATAAIMAQRGDEWIDESNVSKKEDSTYKYYDQNETDSDDESEESEPEVPRNYTRGKWKPGSRPPNNFTGGKWKPEAEKTLIWDENESSNDVNLEKSMEVEDSNPPPSHTKGKWVPGTKITKLEFADKTERNNYWCRFCSRNLATRAIYERHLKSNLHQKRTKQQNDLEEAAETLPLPNLNELSTHFKATSEATSNGIEIFDRAITSTPIIEVHESAEADSVSKEEKELEGNKIYVETKKKKIRSRSKVTCEECDVKLPVHLLGNHLISHFHYRKMLQNPKKSFDIVLNNFHKIIIQSPFQCHPCKFYFNTQDEFLRHWNSIGHVENVARVRGGKFLCSFCKFDCVSNAEMTDHLNSVEHQQVVTLINRSKPVVIRYLTTMACKHCSEEFRYNIQLMKHLQTCEAATITKFNFVDNVVCDVCHKAFQSALSLQKHKMKDHKTSVFFCSECRETFESANDAKIHRKTVQHKTLASRKRMQNDPQLKARLHRNCPVCGEGKLDNFELRDHIIAAHPEHKFSCGRCGEKFPLPQEVSRHVRDKVCKFYRTKNTVQSPTTTSTITSNEAPQSIQTSSLALITPNLNKCESFESFSVNDEVTENSSCLVVGQRLDLIENNLTDILSPTTSYQITTYNEHEESEFEMMLGEVESDEKTVEISFACKWCEFNTDSHAEFLFHEALHRLPMGHNSKDKMECQFCKKLFGQQSLREHLRQHTNERIFECSVTGCPMSFTRKANLKNHIANVHKNDITAPPNVCMICGKKFQSKYILEQHKFIHRNRIETKTFPCQLPNCLYIGRNSTDTKNHLFTHRDEKAFICTQSNCDYRGQTMEQLRSHSRKHQELEFKFTCEHCDYKTKLSSHLKRHMRVHEMEKGKIYKCPHCDYACNNSENLRKHVLKTNKHPGKFLYECVHCTDESTKFKSNLMKKYQSHLQQAHNLMTRKSWGAAVTTFQTSSTVTVDS